MLRGPISLETATVCAIGMAALLTIAVSAALLLTTGGEAPDAGPADPIPSVILVEIAAGYGDGGSTDTPVVRITGTQDAINLTASRVYLIDPGGTLHNVETAILRNATLGEGMTAYVFYLPVDGLPAASGYWITDEPDMVFSTAYHSGVRPFSPGGQWRIVIYDPGLMKNRVDWVFRVT